MTENELIQSNATPLYPRIIVPLDGSDRAETALAPGLALARRGQVPITLFRWEEDRADALGANVYLHRLASERAGDVPVEVAVRTSDDGPVAKCLVAEAARDGGLICIASHGRSGVGKALLGSVTERVLRLSDQPVLVVGPDFEPVPALEGERLVVCLDGSPFAERVIPLATAWADRLGMKPWLVEVVSPEADAQLAGLPEGDVVETNYVTRVASKLPIDVNWDVLHDRHPADAIVGLAGRWPVGLLALATHGRSGWSRVTMGSVAMQVVHAAPCPVLLVRPPAEAAASPGTSR
jgi:nucleotide-binding universal stress UspA family protein